MTKYRVTGEKEIFKARVFTLMSRDVILPTGRASNFSIIEHPGAVAILPVFENGDVILLRQFRVAAGGEIFEIPAGTLEAGETPRATAAREIIEETGYKARKLVKVAEFYTAPGFCTEKMHLFRATGLSPASAHQDEDEVIRALRVPFKKALSMARTGKIRDAKSIVALLLAANGKVR